MGQQQLQPYEGYPPLADSFYYPQLCCVFLCSNMVFPHLSLNEINKLLTFRDTNSAKIRV